MIQNDKELLLKDLCSRLPYGIFVYDEIDNKSIYTISYHPHIDNCKPYLRPMLSTTEEEKEELCKLCDFEKSYNDRDYFSHYGIEIISEYCVNGEKIVESTINYNVIDFFYAHHFDWRGLIPMGLALEAPEGMYK